MIANKRELILLFLFLPLSLVFTDEKSAVWERIYKNSFSDEQRYGVMLNIIELKDRSFIPMLQDSLEKLSTANIEKGPHEEVRQRIALAKIIVKELGNLRASEAGEAVFTVFSQVNDPFLKGEAALTLGKIRATEYLPFLIRELEISNSGPTKPDPRAGEIVAYSLVQALEIMRNPLGYEPVFLASLGWYSARSQVKEVATKALITMVDNPFEALMKILSTNPDLKIKLKATEAMADSKAPEEDKATLARKALETGLSYNGKTREEQKDLLNIRNAAMKLLILAKDRSPDTVTNLKGLVNQSTDENEIITALAVLGVNASDQAASYLSDLLATYNQRQRNGTNGEKENRIIRQLINSLGVAKNPLGKPSLQEMEFSNYTPATVREAKNALKQIP